MSRPRKLTPDVVSAIRTHCRAYPGADAVRRMARKFLIHVRTIERILSGDSYADVPEDYLTLNARKIREIIEAIDEYEAALLDRVLS